MNNEVENMEVVAEKTSRGVMEILDNPTLKEAAVIGIGVSTAVLAGWKLIDLAGKVVASVKAKKEAAPKKEKKGFSLKNLFKKKEAKTETVDTTEVGEA